MAALHCAIKCQQVAPARWDPITLIALGYLSSTVAVTAVISALQRRENPKCFKDVGVPYTNLFLTLAEKGVSCGPSLSK